MEGLGPDLECVHPPEAAMLDASIVVVHVPRPAEPLADLLGDLPEHLEVLPLAEVLGDHEHVAQAQHQPHDGECPG